MFLWFHSQDVSAQTNLHHHHVIREKYKNIDDIIYNYDASILVNVKNMLYRMSSSFIYNSIQFNSIQFIIYVPSQQLQGQLQTQHSVYIIILIYIREKYRNEDDILYNYDASINVKNMLVKLSCTQLNATHALNFEIKNTESM
jgi:hypothetical protein